MSNYTTIVIRMPENEVDKEQVKAGLELLKPFQTAMSLEDEMTVLEMIEQHEDFEEYIAEDARGRALKLQADAEAAGIGKSIS
jgi:hypothetical protein